MKRFRRPNKSTEQPHSLPPQILNRDPAVIEPPKKVITAIEGWNAPGPEYVSFSAGEFFHVVGRENDPNWYIVEGVKGRRGLVPSDLFEEVGKLDLRVKTPNQPPNQIKNEAHDSGYSEERKGHYRDTVSSVGGAEAAEAARKQSMSAQRPSKAGVMIYGVVTFDFKAERPDELDAKAGEKIVIIAMSNPEWFVAKPIQRLGGPGLIPVTFVSVRYTHSDQEVEDPVEAVRAAGIPKVEEWKQKAASYKNNSIPLGQLASANAGSQYSSSQQSLQDGMQRTSVSNSGSIRRSVDTYRDGRQQHQQQRGSHYSQTSSHRPGGLITPNNGWVAGCSRDPETREHWFRVEVNSEDRRAFALKRFYKEFYELQLHLTEQFPDEAGKYGGQRMLPTIPGPLPNASLNMQKQRIPQLDNYVRTLLRLPRNIYASHPVKLFFSPRPESDEEIAPFDPNTAQRDSAISSQSSQTDGYSHSHHQSQTTQSSGPFSSPQRLQPQQSYRPQSPQGHPQPNHYRSPSDLRAPNGGANGLPYQVQRNHSAMTAGSQTSLASSQQPAHVGASATISKVKVFLGENCILLRLSSTFTFPELMAKVKERWLLEPGNEKVHPDDVELGLEYRDEQSQQRYALRDDQDLHYAKTTNDKLTLWVHPT